LWLFPRKSFAYLIQYIGLPFYLGDAGYCLLWALDERIGRFQWNNIQLKRNCKIKWFGTRWRGGPIKGGQLFHKALLLLFIRSCKLLYINIQYKDFDEENIKNILTKFLNHLNPEQDNVNIVENFINEKWNYLFFI